MISFKKVSKEFKDDLFKSNFIALKEVEFSLKAGSITGFLGANGAGKTTSLKILMGFIKATSGHIEFDKELGSTQKEILASIGYLPERPYFYPYLTGREMVHYLGQLNNVPKSDMNLRLEKWSKRFRIDFALDRKINGYSKGMLQRLGYILSLIHDPKLIIFDEPLSGLDPIGRKEIKEAIIELNNEGKTIFFSSHIVPDVEEICDSVIFIEKGQTIYEGSIDKLIQDNLKPNFDIRVKGSELTDFKQIKTLGDGSRLYEIGNEQKKAFLAKITEQGGDILHMSPQKLTLEEILYKVRNKTREESREDLKS